MEIKATNAAIAYTEALNRAAGLGAPTAPQGTGDGQSFAELVQDFAQDAVGAVKNGELASMKGITGEADVVGIVTAVNNAEVTLQTVVALRDRVLQAYQEIMRMPI